VVWRDGLFVVIQLHILLSPTGQHDAAYAQLMQDVPADDWYPIELDI
jgi:hypothetical protein